MDLETYPKVRVDPEACTGCQACSIVCVLSHSGVLAINRARIRVKEKLPQLTSPAFVPTVCQMCQDAPCVKACPSEALVQDVKTGVVLLRADLCTGCGICRETCPFDAIWMDSESGVALKCDLCGGKPLCVEHCAPRALTFE